ncbi:AMP-binding protein [Aquabacterium sp. J223]|uniref:AMP-binding protein n=1 Tax=Aquabacterium sp. J223 TaxID=2898431 RepID=UPI0021AD626C|nr:AMP-binding protein [Aquabacterium sp. J223]UUX94369.1 AMP-binding protein [Aquabacterium sp. J223]
MGVHSHESRWTAEPGPALLSLTVGDLLDRRADERADRPFLLCRNLESGEDTDFTLGGLRRQVNAFAKGLIGLGVQAGDKVGVLCSNRAEWLVANFALAKIGAVLVTVNTQSRQAELSHIVRQAELSGLILQRSHRGNPFLEHLRAIVPDLGTPGSHPTFRLAVLVGEPGVDEPGTVGFDAVVAAGAEAPDAVLAERQAAVKPTDVWQIQFTSGTTGAAKGAMLTHHGTVNNAWVFGGAVGLREGDSMVSAMPLFHTAGNIVEVLGALVHRARLIKTSSFEAGAMLELIAEQKPTVLCAVPTMLIAMWNHPTFLATQSKLDSLRLLIGGGTPYPVPVLTRLRDDFGVVAQIGFGMTELSPMVTCTAMDDPLERKSLTVGRPLPHLEVKVVGEDGATCPHGQPGELLVRGFGVTPGYYRQPDATARTIDAEGWLHSGDLASMDADGTVRIVGRLKDMIKRGGENVYPAEVENFLMQHPKVAQAQVVGVPDEYMGEEAAAFIQARPGETVTAEELEAYCRAHIARHKLPKYFRFVDGYPLTGSGKVMKFALRDRLVKELSTT